ncbi:hypothetical protein NA57DRAFT_41719 [Rhizodiscina lignyota]|uniref:Spermatogenesis-associated protein 20-like TRX domain-containing protein n=1 Tax=Rhizodiscina lignyota TaxID=1504668 RepID=A0A9P4ICS0_9PEZI|nr:hypothetical protein NA57DRAFT_41719 [Rhizodiscina lignyota]
MDVRPLTGPSASPSGGGTPETDKLHLTNQLSKSRSPYVRGHMTNPVAWQMWTPESLALAKQSQRLIFVSIGYAACHWCHVMERESFANREVAALLNANFIPIKIDREERPDIDRIYMNYVQATTGGGGWPLNVFLTPDLEPLFGGTYWPGPGTTANYGGGVSGFQQILEKMADVWKNQRQRCLVSAKEITGQLREFAQEGLISRQGEGEGDGLDLESVEEAYSHFEAKFDKVNAGFGSAPKFPTPVNLRFLLRLGVWPQEVRDVVGEAECMNARQMAVETLRAMWRGGIKDQIGYGIARYSVTKNWSLPHFEKMLYDQAQLLDAYTDAWLLTGDKEMKAAIEDVATYLTTAPMYSKEGGFFSSEDADSKYRASDPEKREGAFYVWTYKEFQSLLGDPDAGVAAKYWNVKENGNVPFEHDAHDELINQNVLAVSSTPEALAKEFGLTVDEVERILKEAREKLRAHREKERPRPDLDDKIVVAWNGLAIGALARASAALGEVEPEKAKAWKSAAIGAAEFIKRELWDEQEKRLWRVWREGRGEVLAFADDYAFLIQGLMDLYEATWDDAWLQWADDLQKTQIALFNDKTTPLQGGFFSTVSGSPDLILRLKDGMDNAEPSSNGISARNLNRLASILEDESYAQAASLTVDAFEAEVMQHPFLFTSLLSSVVAARLGTRNIQVIGGGEEAEQIVKELRKRVRANATVVRIGEGGKSEWLKKRNTLLASLDASGTAKVMLCEKGACRELAGGELDGLIK